MLTDENVHHILKIILPSNIAIMYESVTLLEVSVFLKISFLTMDTQLYGIFGPIVLI
jgi:hypothetical protein